MEYTWRLFIDSVVRGAAAEPQWPDLNRNMDGVRAPMPERPPSVDRDHDKAHDLA
jgi:hypothetical protein